MPTLHEIRALPPRGDPRYVQLTVLLLYAITAREVFHMDRPHWITAGCCALALLLDVLFGYLRYRVLRFPVSSLIIGLATSLLIDSRYPFVYFAAVTAAITSKALLTYRGFHLFNPANFGVVCALMLLPQYTTGMPALFGGYVLPSLVFFALGSFTVVYAHQVVVSFSWLIGFFVFAGVRAAITGASFLITALPVLSPTFLLFTFHMISDPATSPKTRNYRIAYGIIIAAMDALFRLYQIPYGNFYSLFIVTACMPWVRDLELSSKIDTPKAI